MYTYDTCSFHLKKVFRLAYCIPFDPQLADESKQICQDFVDCVKNFCPENLKKMKIHLLLHLYSG